jgi:hypothetical protein
MIPREFDAISKEDVEALVINAVSEGRTIEYKERLPGGADDDKREFLADASSFANAGGGDLIYGIREKRDANGNPTGLPEAADGLSGSNSDAEIRRLDEMLRSGIDPRIPGVRLKDINGFPTGPVVVLRVPKSWASPHMVVFKNNSRFFSRTSAGKHQLDVREIRAAFIASDSLTRQISAFRSDRIAKVLSNSVPFALEQTPKVIVHLLALSSFTEPATMDLKTAQALPTREFEPMGRPGSFGPEFNFDGYAVSATTREPQLCESYVQLFRNGAIEAVWTSFTREKSLLIGPLERELHLGIPRYLKLLKKLGVEPPLFVGISLVGVKGLQIITDNWRRTGMFGKPIDRDALLLPEILIEESGSNVGESLRPAMDTIWQASGWARSLGYDENGKLVGSFNY